LPGIISGKPRKNRAGLSFSPRQARRVSPFDLICSADRPRLEAMAVISNETTDDERLAAIVSDRDRSDRAMRAAQDAFGQLYQRHARRLLAFLAARVPRCDLNDLHQEVWLRAWRHLPSGFHGGNVRAWLHQIARNGLIDRSRRRRAEPLPDELSLLDPRGEQPGDLMQERERLAVLKRCLERLDEVEAYVVRSRLTGEGYPAICARLGLTPARAHKLFHRAKDQLQTCVERVTP
jgi:RNA polymerase sigma-70 factor, ECF subfamily